MAEEEEEDTETAPPIQRTQLGALRVEVTRLEQTVNDINTRLKALADGRKLEPDTGSTTGTMKVDPSTPLLSITERIKAARLRLEHGALERLRRIGD